MGFNKVRQAAIVMSDMVQIPSGSFVMGGVDDDKFTGAAEGPPVRVVFDHDFQMGRCPVTVAEYRAFLEDISGSYTTHRLDDLPGDWPMMGVNRDDAMDYCDWLSRRTGQDVRLPTEAQWEYACRAGTDTVFYHGDAIGLNDANYAYDEAGRLVGLNHPTPVGSYLANPWGLCDMLGSVMELVADDWSASLNAKAPTDPLDDRRDKSVANRSVVRGGAWDHMPRLLRCSHRDWIDNNKRRVDNVGFRIVVMG